MTTPQGVRKPPSQGPSQGENERPWYDLISDVPEIPEDAMEQEAEVNYVRTILAVRYEDDPTVLVAGPLANLIYDSAVPGSVVAPDCFVVFGVDARTIKLHRRSYRIEEWGVVPSFVLEVATESTAPRDLSEKRRIYERMGVEEYWRLDKDGRYYGEPLVGERLVAGEYQRLDLHREANGDSWSRSQVLGLDFYHRIEEEVGAAEGVGRFLLRDAVTGEWLNFLGDEHRARIAERAAFIANREELEARNRELEAELERLRQQLPPTPSV